MDDASPLPLTAQISSQKYSKQRCRHLVLAMSLSTNHESVSALNHDQGGCRVYDLYCSQPLGSDPDDLASHGCLVVHLYIQSMLWSHICFHVSHWGQQSGKFPNKSTQVQEFVFLWFLMKKIKFQCPVFDWESSQRVLFKTPHWVSAAEDEEMTLQ